MTRSPNKLDYQMTKKMFDGILKSRTEGEKKENPYTYVMKVLNEEGGYLGTITHISLI